MSAHCFASALIADCRLSGGASLAAFARSPASSQVANPLDLPTLCHLRTMRQRHLNCDDNDLAKESLSPLQMGKVSFNYE